MRAKHLHRLQKNSSTAIESSPQEMIQKRMKCCKQEKNEIDLKELNVICLWKERLRGGVQDKDWNSSCVRPCCQQRQDEHLRGWHLSSEPQIMEYHQFSLKKGFRCFRTQGCLWVSLLSRIKLRFALLCFTLVLYQQTFCIWQVLQREFPTKRELITPSMLHKSCFQQSYTVLQLSIRKRPSVG